MHPKLIKANIALFEGARLEAQRLLQEYISEQGAGWQNDPDAPMVMWLDAQAQGDWAERVSRLNALVAQVDASNYYAGLARAYLHEEETYQEKLRPREKKHASRFTLFGIGLWQALFFSILGGLVVFGVDRLLEQPGNTPPQTITGDTAPEIESEQATFVGLPDHSQPLVADSFTARYDGGILQVLAIEDQSERIIEARSSERVSPVPGARFYALSLAFECRFAICNNPPEATLALRLDNGSLIEMRSDVIVAGQPLLEAVALGRKTNGWAVFEIPIISSVAALSVTYNEDDVTAEPMSAVIVLP